MSGWDRRQLVQARGRLLRAARQLDLAIDHLDDGREAGLRASWAWKMADEAQTDLRRFVRRQEAKP